jgi:predicted component of type VI protein secretion system
MQVTLFVRAPKKPEKRVVVDHDVVIGRGKDCNLRVLSNDVSRQHCRLIVGESEVAIRDLGSGNGTSINNHETEPHTDAALNSGDFIQIGPLVIEVEFQAAATETLDAAPAEPAAAAVTEAPVEAAIAETEPLVEAAGWEPDPDDAAPDEPALDDAVLEVEPSAIPEAAPEPEQFLEPADNDELMADASVADESTEADPAELESTEANAAETLEAEPRPGKLKSFFGRFGRKKKQNDDAEVELQVTESESASASGDADQQPLLVADNVNSDQETVVFGQENAFPPEEDDAELLYDDEGLSDEGDYLDDYIEEEDAEEETADPGFADFLNKVDQPPD